MKTTSLLLLSSLFFSYAPHTSKKESLKKVIIETIEKDKSDVKEDNYSCRMPIIIIKRD